MALASRRGLLGLEQLARRLSSSREVCAVGPGSRRPRPRPAGRAAAAAAPPPTLPVPADAVGPSTGGWTPLRHKETGLTYYWNEQTGETTALGEPRPGPEGRVAAPGRQAAPSLLGLVAAGAGMGCVFGLLRYLF